MKPDEFWNSTYREIDIYSKANLCEKMDEFRKEINLQEEITNKMIMADPMMNKYPKIIPLHRTFKEIFPEKEEKVATADEITRRMREIMESS